MTSGPAPQLVVATTEQLGAERFARIDALCEAAFGQPFAAIWSSIGPGIHVIAELGGETVGHAMVVARELHVGAAEQPLRLRTGYVENVAAAPDRHGGGIGSQVMRCIGELIAAEFDIGALATGTNPFYARLGWETWGGPTSVRTERGTERTPDADGNVMLLRAPSTPPLAGDEPISIGWRSGAIW